MSKRPYVSFKAFFTIWAEKKGWRVPDFHIAVCDYLEHRGRTAVMEIFRGAGKSTILALYQAWKLRSNPRWRFIDRSADDQTATKLSADTQNILRLHPLCAGLLGKETGAVKRFNVKGNPDPRNASVTAYGILSNATSSRADEIVNDDVEVPKNIEKPETRAKLRDRLGEETHIIVPGGKILYVGTPHTHNSLYDERIGAGYDKLVIPLFLSMHRVESDGQETYFPLPFTVTDPADLYVIAGIWKHARVLTPDQYRILPTGVQLLAPLPLGTIVDFSYGNPWPEYFTRAEVEFKRKECRTFNAWDSQYLLKAKPVHEVRLDPEKCGVYDELPAVTWANGVARMMIGNRRMVNVRACWDCSLGKADSDDSVFSVMFQDDGGQLFWQLAEVMTGDVYDQAMLVRRRVIEYNIPGIIIKTKGIGGYLPSIMREVLRQGKDGKQQPVQCGITNQDEQGSKANRILTAYEPLLSARALHVHQTVMDGGLRDQMQDWVPINTNQPDDILDAGEGCITGLPVKLGKLVAPADRPRSEVLEPTNWRQAQETYEAEVDFS